MKLRYSVLTLLFFVPTLAAAAVSYTVTPLIINTDAEPRDILTFDITLTNTGTQPVTVYPTVNNISVDEGGTIQQFLPPVSSDRTASLAAWIEISRAGIKLPVGESKTVTLTLRINPTPKSGEYHALIGFGSGRNRDIAQQMVQLGRAPGTVVTVTIEDRKIELLKLGRFIIDRFVTSKENQSAAYVIKNPGDETLTPSGEIIFYNNRGVEVASLPVNDENEQIAPGAEKEFKTVVPVDGLFGKYKAFLSVEYGSSQVASVQDTAFFYVFPVKTLLIILAVVLVVVILAALYIHKRYFDDALLDDSDTLPLHVKITQSDAMEHDIDLKQQ